MFGPPLVTPEPPYRRPDGRCLATSEKIDLLGNRTPVDLSKPLVPRRCLRSLEPLDPKLPFRNVADQCAQHKRRWKWKLGTHAGHIDWDAIDKRQARAVMLDSPASGCPVAGHRRKVYIDAGCRNYSSSVGWFREHYPGGQDFAIHAFDVDKQYARWYKHDRKATFHNAAVWSRTGYVTFFIGKKLMMGAMGAEFHERADDVPRGPSGMQTVTVASVGLSDFLHKTTTPEDFVVLKIDVEGSEWQLMQHLAVTGALRRVDEVFMECHSYEWNPGWPHDRTLADCHRLFNALREAGVYVHEWY